MQYYRKVPLSEAEKAGMVAKAMGIERKRMTADERDALMHLAALKTLTPVTYVSLEKRAKNIKLAKARLGLLAWLSEWLVNVFMASIPDDQIESMKRNLEGCTFQIGARKVVKNGDADEWGLWVSNDDLNALMEAAENKCLTCDLHDSRERSCKLRAALDRLGADGQHDAGKGCEYRWL